jgi:apolipoprotein N-acyltransferase
MIQMADGVVVLVTYFRRINRGFESVGAHLRQVSGFRRLGMAAAVGGVSAVGFAPVNLFPALLGGFAVLVLLLDGVSVKPHPIRNAATTGCAFAFGQYVVGLHWVGYALLVDPSRLWQMPFAVLLLSFGLSLFVGASCALSVLFLAKRSRTLFHICGALRRI